MKTRLTILGSVIAMSLAACAAAPEGAGAADTPETTATTESALTLAGAPVRPYTPPAFPAPVIMTTLDRWKARCGSEKTPVGVIVPRATWSCPTIPSGPGAYVGVPGWQYLSEGHALGLDDATLMAWTPDLTPAMVSYAQPFCAYTYEIAAGTPQANNGTNPVNVCASRITELEAAVGAAAGPLCVVLSHPYPGSTGCPSCWAIFRIPYIAPYPVP